MWTSCWKPNNLKAEPTASKIYIYDAGDYVGIHYDDNWHCWQVLGRTANPDGSVSENLKMMP